MDCLVCGTVVVGQRRSKRYCSQRCRDRKRAARLKFDRKNTNRVAQSRRWPAPTPPQLADLAWLAGIIDGEGTIFLSHGSTGTPHLRVGITNGSQPILDKIQALLDGLTIAYYAYREVRGTTNIIIGTDGSLRLHELLRQHLVRQVEQFDAAVAFLRPRYDGALRVYWTQSERDEWNAMRRKFHPGSK